ncbi:hypothetical protein PTKIN_Ptkin07bG0312600 [Pterospermum kingtungense]
MVKFSGGEKSWTKPFKFFNFWVRHADFMKTIEDSKRVQFEGNPLYALHLKLKHLKKALRCFNKTHFGKISSKVKDKRKELATIQRKIMDGLVSFEVMKEESKVRAELKDLLFAGESYYIQKARVQWVK